MSGVEFRISGRVALVTGGASGMGRAISLGFARAGLAVAVVDLEGGRAGNTASEIEAAGGRALGLAADVSNAASVQEVVARAERELGPIDVLVNCAGIYPRTLVVDMSEAEWRRVLETNLTSVFLVSQAVASRMIPRRTGRIVTITSSVGVTGNLRSAHYAASKGGINGFMRSLAREMLEYGINVNAIAPGSTDTPMMRGGNTPESMAAKAREMPGGRIGQPEDVVGIVLFLASEGADYITGQVLNLRGWGVG
jgi:NAD(P)-dependent dehydrogenase (short-subunit alcohol dehydrogenase family)